MSEKLFTAEVEEVLAVNMDSSTWSHLRIPVPTLIAIEKLSSTCKYFTAIPNLLFFLQDVGFNDLLNMNSDKQEENIRE